MRARTEPLIFRFGPFELDAGRRRLTREGRRVDLADRQMDTLLFLIDNAEETVEKDVLIDAAWHGLAVTDNSLVKAVSRLRCALGPQPDGTPYVETLPRAGYRFTAPVERVDAAPSRPIAGRRTATTTGGVQTLLDPFRVFVEGRTALETLEQDSVRRAFDAFTEALRLQPGFAAAHVGLANAYLLTYESIRADRAPDATLLVQAEQHAREGCRLDPSLGDAWSTLAAAIHRSRRLEALAAAQKAVELEPEEWRHYLRLAWVSWGGDRLRAATRLQALCPGLALAHWFAATVFVARGALAHALEHLSAGCAIQDTAHAPRTNGGPFAAVGLHFLNGLVLAAMGADGALDELQRELVLDDPGHVYARECRANTWYGIGALNLRRGSADTAASAFEQALAIVPGHPLACIGLAFATGAPAIPMSEPTVRQERRAGESNGLLPTPNSTNAAIVHAVTLAMQGHHDHAARLCCAALSSESEQGSDGWMLPIEPLLHVTARLDVWAPALATLRARSF